jgi:hypothetical protein
VDNECRLVPHSLSATKDQVAGNGISLWFVVVDADLDVAALLEFSAERPLS